MVGRVGTLSIALNTTRISEGESERSFGTKVAIDEGPTSSAGLATFSPCRIANPYICFRISRTWIAVAGAPRATMLTQCARRSFGEISASSLLRHTGRSSRSKIERRMARVLSAVGAVVSHFSPNSPKLLDSFRRRFSRCFSIAGEMPSAMLRLASMHLSRAGLGVWSRDEVVRI